MSRHRHWLEKLLPSPATDNKYSNKITHSYRNFSRGLCVILLILVFAPLTLVSLLSHYQYENLLQEEELDQLVLNLEEAQLTIEHFVSELESVIKFVARDDRYEELLDPTELQALFVRLKNEYPGFADIEVVDSEGNQKAYFGNYSLGKYNYTDQTWYKEVIQHGVYISSIFTGFRHVPHFVIAVSRKYSGNQKHWVLRVTIEGQTLQHFIDTIRTSYADDMFLVDSEGIAQTQPLKYGQIGERCILHSIAGEKEQVFFSKMSNEMTIVKKTVDKQKINHAAVSLVNAPWKLVLIKEQYLHASSWTNFKIKLVTMFLTCVVIAFFVVFEISTAITNHLRESDRKRQQLYSEAEHSNKLASVGRLAAGVAHEINNPLSIINQKTGLVQDFMEFSGDFEHKKAMAEALEGIQSSINRCKTITHRLLGFARHTDVERVELDINNLLREVIDFLAKEATYNQIRIAFNLDQNVGKIISDRGPLQQVFLNITNNAIDAIGDHGTIILSSKQVDQQHVLIQITDDGPGMSEEVRDRIFEPFFTTKETGKGTGLGLSITYGLVRKLGGDIKVISEIGEGTTFEITLPVQQSE
jgi:two-component system, NtrC family, sensor kinase